MVEPKTLIGDVRSSRWNKLLNPKGRLGFPVRLAKKHPKWTLLVLILVIAAVIYGYRRISYQPTVNPIQAVNINDSTANQKLINEYLKVDTTQATNDEKAIYYSNLALLYQAKQDYQSAFNALKQAESVSPRDPQIQENLADVLVILGRKQEAKEYYQKALAGFETLPQNNEGVLMNVEDIKQKLAAL